MFPLLSDERNDVNPAREIEDTLLDFNAAIPDIDTSGSINNKLIKMKSINRINSVQNNEVIQFNSICIFNSIYIFNSI